jgi:very-short-patch-repair endonuclease
MGLALYSATSLPLSFGRFDESDVGRFTSPLPSGARGSTAARESGSTVASSPKRTWRLATAFPVTTLARTLFDLAEVAPFEQLEGAAEEADRLKLLRLPELEQCCERGHGRRALRPIRRLLAELRPPDEGRSPLEIRFQDFVRAHDLPAPFQNADVLGHEVDALWPAAKLIVELDSWEHHGHRAAFERDRTRDPKLLIAGYRTVRVTHRRLDREGEQLADEIRQLLAITPPR